MNGLFEIEKNVVPSPEQFWLSINENFLDEERIRIGDEEQILALSQAIKEDAQGFWADFRYDGDCRAFVEGDWILTRRTK